MQGFKIGPLKLTGVFYLAHTVYFFKVEPTFKIRDFLIKNSRFSDSFEKLE
jgi:hypothetical protein